MTDTAVDSAKIQELESRIAALEAQVSQLSKLAPTIDEETLTIIAAAVAGYLGVKAKVRAVHYSTTPRFGQAGRAAVHRHDVL